MTEIQLDQIRDRLLLANKGNPWVHHPHEIEDSMLWGVHTLLRLLPQLGVRGLSCIVAKLLYLVKRVIDAAQVRSLLIVPTPDVI